MKWSAAPIWVLSFLSCACSELPKSLSPLRDLEQPLELFEEPGDEAERLALPLGSFTGIQVVSAGESLEDLTAGGLGVRVDAIVENSPGDAAGLTPGDLLYEATIEGGTPREIEAPSNWRQVELEAPPGRPLRLLIDRAGLETEVAVTPVARVRAPEREEAERFTEEARVGVVLRTATEVEARGAGLGPGGGAVIVGLARSSPWRTAGLGYRDLIVSVDGRSVSHPQVVLDAIRSAEEPLDMVVVRSGERLEVDAPISERESHLTELSIPLIFSYTSDLETTEVSLPLGLIHWSETEAAWRLRLLWLIGIGGGEKDVLEEVDT
ncbi:MAG: hypothetical protein RL885_13440 [Planctomycetota bacterium]